MAADSRKNVGVVKREGERQRRKWKANGKCQVFGMHEALDTE